jgi:heptaprenyl diphosphate synthase
VHSRLDLLGIRGLDHYLATVDGRLATTCRVSNPELASSARMVATAGKRLRPALTVATASLGNVFDARVVAAAVSVELVQVGSLVHDDIFDAAETRRGIPTINAVEGRNEALCAGTYLLARAAAEAAAAGQEVVVDVDQTVIQLCIGQAIETEHLFDVDQDIEQYLLTIEGKTDVFFGCACRAGVLAAGLPKDYEEPMGEFGRNFGMAFQIIDDVLDLVGDPAALGKPVGTDIRAGVLTLPALLELADRSGGDLRALLMRKGSSDIELAARMIAGSDRIDEAIQVARSFADAASAAIAEVPNSTIALSSFPRSYIDWALEEYRAA